MIYFIHTPNILKLEIALKLKIKSKNKLNIKKPKVSLELKETCDLEDLNGCEFVSSGSWIMDLASTNTIGKCYPIGRVSNLIGGYSVGKTLCACEVVNQVWYIEHLIKGKKVVIIYDEPEASFDFTLAKGFNMPLNEIIGLRQYLSENENNKQIQEEFKTSKIAEDLYTNVKWASEQYKNKDIILYVVDSLDSLSDSRELTHVEKKGIEKQDYGGGKAGVLSKLFRLVIQDINSSNMVLLILSQIRDNFGVMFGPKHTRSGGNALDHYASIIAWLTEKGKITHKETNFNQGIAAEVKFTKNKVGSRYNAVTFNILHGYGIDNISSAVDYLWDNRGFEISGPRLEWDGKKIFKTELVELCANDKNEEEKLKNILQEFWNNQVEKSKIKRLPKYGF